MKKKMIMIACCLLLAGVGLVGIGIGFGGTLNFYYALGSKVITDSQLQYDMQTDTVESFDSIDVKLDGFGDCQLELTEGDGYSVTYPKENRYVTSGYKIENGVLKLETKKKRRLVLFQMDFLEHKGEKQIMQITVPKGTKLSSLKVDSEAGDLINTLDADTMILDLEYGDVEIADSSLGNLIVEDDSGNVKIENSNLENGDITLSYGKLNMRDSNVQTAKFNLESGDMVLDNMMLGQTELEMSFGSLTAEELTLDTLTGTMESSSASLFLTGAKEDYSLKIMVEAGAIKIGDEKVAGGSYQYDAPNTASKIELENEFGDIRLEFGK